MFPVTRQLLLAVAAALCLSAASAHDLPMPHVDQPIAPVINGQTMGLTVAFAQPQQPVRRLRAQHNGEDHGGVISPGGGEINPQTGVKNPGGILGPLYATFPQLLAPLAMASDNIHNSNAAVSGVQHTPDGIFQA